MIRFNVPIVAENTIKYIQNALETQHVAGDGKYTKSCKKWFETRLRCHQALLMNSGTAALELSAKLANLTFGDEVIMPSYTFCSTANAFITQEATPVFVDIRSDTLNIDENLIKVAITPKTKAIVVVHYAGVACNMDEIMGIARRHHLLVIEDAAQAFDSYYNGKPLGTIGDMGCMSFHETKNISCGEGGLFITNNQSFAQRAEILREKGTNRSSFFRGEIDKYTWLDNGSSYLPSDLIAAYLYSILKISNKIQRKRIDIWNAYYNAFLPLQRNGYVKLPQIPPCATNNAHMFYLLLRDSEERENFISYLKGNDIMACSHYVPLHSSPAGKKFCKTFGSMQVTDHISKTLVRLPLYFDMKEEELQRIIRIVLSYWEVK